jgi:hypothetical protein
VLVDWVRDGGDNGYIMFGGGRTGVLVCRGEVAGVLGAVEFGELDADEYPFANGLAVLSSVRAPAS